MIVIIAFVLFALIAAAGVAIDMARVESAKDKLEKCLDTAGLAAISKIGDTPNNMTVKHWIQHNVDKYFSVNCRFGYMGMGVIVTGAALSADGNELTLDAVTRQPTKLMSIAGIDSVTVTAHSVVRRAAGDSIELALVLDNTGSMDMRVDPSQTSSAKKIDALKSATRMLINKLNLRNAATPNAWIGIVPFSQAVNIGGTGSPASTWNAGWVKHDNNNEDFGPAEGYNTTCDAYNGRSSTTSGNSGYCTYPGTATHFRATHWYGCVGARAEPYDTSDDTASAAPFPVYEFLSQSAADVANAYPQSSYPQLYQDATYINKLANEWKFSPIRNPDGTTMSGTQYKSLLLNVVNPATVPPASPYPLGPNAYCPPAVTPLTHDRTALLTGISAMQPGGQTIIPVALAWGWRMLSPKWRGAWGGEMGQYGLPYDYNQKGKQKALVFVTDGYNYFFPGSYTAYGKLADGQLGTKDEAKAEQELDRRTLALCSAMKEQGIQIYTVAFGQSDNINSFAPAGAQAEVNGKLMQDCATSPRMYFFAPTNGKLNSAFDAIANSLLNPRVIQ
ncbi:MAG TPA: Tad domain-containing protein [Rickettsiales bacterium]|nr:Tad domain-containing protein [Rickettsiales bacterium]